MNTLESFQPNRASPPGSSIRDFLDESGLSSETLAQRLREEVDFLEDLIKGLVSIDEHLANKLENTIGGSSQFWLKREERYREAVSRNPQEYDTPYDKLSWLEALPLNYLKKHGAISRSTSKEILIQDCITFFDTDSIKTWISYKNSFLANTRFRSSNAFESKDASVVTWLKMATNIADDTPCSGWSASKVISNLNSFRELTRIEDPSTFIPPLKVLCAKHGIAFVPLQTPKGSTESGAAKFLSTDKTMIVASFRHYSDDHFWFTFFHELGHLIHGHVGQTYIDSGSEFDDAMCSSEEERLANNFSRDALIPAKYTEEFNKLRPSIWSITRFARKAGVSKGIIVGQLQHQGKLSYATNLNRMKARYSKNFWSNL